MAEKDFIKVVITIVRNAIRRCLFQYISGFQRFLTSFATVIANLIAKIMNNTPSAPIQRRFA